MAETDVQIVYNEQLQPLETLLEGVRRPGNFYVDGAVEIPLPRVEVEGVGVLSFPVPEAQVQTLIAQSARAPYGRGPETVLDTSVRKVWQLAAEKVTLSGKSWAGHFHDLVAEVARGLGCGETPVAAELYKLLVYDPGGFFLAHRDTEKAAGMFGTLVVVLPCPHRGGELIIRHAGREVSVDLRGGEVSELTFAAFYADCEHEVRPVTEGHRVCLIYNLLQPSAASPATSAPLQAPLYDRERAEAADLLRRAFAADASPAKLVWLLEHHYSPAELSFATLKNADAARAHLLCQAGELADCAVHLGIVHIEESGAAEPDYDASYYNSRRSRGRSRRYDDEEESAGGDEFEIIEIQDGQHSIDNWVDTANRPVAFGPLPLGDGELFPNGALDGEKPDEQRLLEASGNEGCSFERAYHRAALVLWPTDRFGAVLLQAGASAALPYLVKLIDKAGPSPSGEVTRRQAVALARQITGQWHPRATWSGVSRENPSPARSRMLTLLGRLAEAAELERFLSEVVVNAYDGSENDALVEAAAILSPRRAEAFFSRLLTAQLAKHPAAGIDLLGRLTVRFAHAADWPPALRTIAGTVVAGLETIPEPPTQWSSSYLYFSAGENWQGNPAPVRKPYPATLITRLTAVLLDLDAPALLDQATATWTARPAVLDPVHTLVPSLLELPQERGPDIIRQAFFTRLWTHAAGFLLQRSATPPAPPSDWRLEVHFEARDDDARELQDFLRDPQAQTHRFRINQGRRYALEQIIRQHDLDLSYTTERKGSPQTLICSKTRRAFARRCARYREDLAAMGLLLILSAPPPGGPEDLRPRLRQAITLANGFTADADAWLKSKTFQKILERPATVPAEVTLPEAITVRELAEALHVRFYQVVAVLMSHEIFQSADDVLDVAAASLVCAHYGVTPRPAV